MSDEKTVHKVHVQDGDVVARCTGKPLDPKIETWTLREQYITCEECKEAARWDK